MSTCEQLAGDFELPETVRSEFKGANFLSAAGIKGDMHKLEQLADSFENDPFTLELLTAYLKRWFAGRLNGLESIPVLYDKNPDKRPLRRVLAAFERKLSGASDMTLLYLLSLSDQPVPQQPMKLVFRSTLVERWLTRRDDYVRFLGPLGRLNEDHWHWVIENLRRLKLLEPATSGRHDLLLVPEPVRAYFRNELKTRHFTVYEQALADMDKLFKETVVSLYEKAPDRPDIKTWIDPDYQSSTVASVDAEAVDVVIGSVVGAPIDAESVDVMVESRPAAPVFWEETELDAAREQLLALRKSMASLREHSQLLQQHLQQLKPLA